MLIFFYISSLVAIISTIMVITQKNAIHALLYLIISFLSIAVIIYLTGSPFMAILEIIIYAGAIMTLFIFVVIMLNLGPKTVEQEKKWLSPRIWAGPSVLAIILLTEFFFVFKKSALPVNQLHSIGTKQVGYILFIRYIPAVELAGILLMTAIIGAYHIGYKKKKAIHRYIKEVENND